jgi:hypothetical protein
LGRPFPEGIFYEFEGRKYCEHDFHVLFAPCCSKCGEFIIGRVIKVITARLLTSLTTHWCIGRRALYRGLYGIPMGRVSDLHH